MLDSLREVQRKSAEQQQQIVERQNRTDSDVARLTEEVAQAREDLRLTREQLSDAVAKRIAATRDEDSAIIEGLSQAPSWESILGALVRAKDLRLISDKGCRIALFDSDLYLRFTPDFSYFDNLSETEPDVIGLTLERSGGSAISNIEWGADKSPADIALMIAEEMQSAGTYPGDNRFKAGEVFASLGELLRLAHDRATNKHGNAASLGRLVQLCPPQWAIADDGLYSIDPKLPYHVAAEKFSDMNWTEHMRGKPWVDIDSFDEAFSIGYELYRSLRLGTKPRSPFDDVPF